MINTEYKSIIIYRFLLRVLWFAIKRNYCFNFFLLKLIFYSFFFVLGVKQIMFYLIWLLSET
jgi:hypothetical protein